MTLRLYHSACLNPFSFDLNNHTYRVKEMVFYNGTEAEFKTNWLTARMDGSNASNDSFILTESIRRVNKGKEHDAKFKGGIFFVSEGKDKYDGLTATVYIPLDAVKWDAEPLTSTDFGTYTATYRHFKVTDSVGKFGFLTVRAEESQTDENIREAKIHELVEVSSFKRDSYTLTDKTTRKELIELVEKIRRIDAGEI